MQPSDLREGRLASRSVSREYPLAVVRSPDVGQRVLAEQECVQGEERARDETLGESCGSMEKAEGGVGAFLAGLAVLRQYTSRYASSGALCRRSEVEEG